MDDMDLDLVDSANDIYYRGEMIQPKKLRVQSMTTPIHEGYGVYLRYWNGASFSYYDVTPYVDFAAEQSETTLELGTRARYHPKNARPHRFNRRRIRRQQRNLYIAAQYAASVGN